MSSYLSTSFDVYSVQDICEGFGEQAVNIIIGLKRSVTPTTLDLREYSKQDALGLAGLVRNGEVTPKQLAELLLEGVEKVNPKINAVIETYPDRIPDLKISTGPFAGVPFLLKDLGPPEEGKLQEKGSRLTKGFVAKRDSYLTIRFRDAGLSLLGRTAVPEFGTASTTETTLIGPTRNPWNLNIITGGSSGGAAAAVAAGILPVASASDGGGSIRIPASCCGLVGLKPSRGRVTQGPDQSEGHGGLGQSFVVSRSVRDSAVMLDAVSEPAMGDPYIILQPERPYSKDVGAAVRRLRIAWTTKSWRPDVPVDLEVGRLVERTALECEKMGLEVREATPEFDYESYLFAFSSIFAYGFDVYLDRLSAEMGRPISAETVEPVNLSQYKYAQSLTSKDMAYTNDVLNKFRRTFGEFFRDYEILMTPTLSLPPGPIGRYTTEREDLDYVGYIRMTDELNMHMPAANITGLPAISLPLGQSNSGLPLGVQLIARFGQEGVLIRLACALEEVMPWAGRTPPVHVSH